MALSDGWVVDVPGLARAQQLAMLGNGVVPLQAAHALEDMLTHAPGIEWVAPATTLEWQTVFT